MRVGNDQPRQPTKEEMEKALAARAIAAQAYTKPEKRAFKNFTPLGDLIALEVHREDPTAKYGIMTPEGYVDTVDSRPITATVIAVGPLCKQVKEGDVILATPATQGFNITYGDSGKVMMVREAQLVGISIHDSTIPT